MSVEIIIFDENNEPVRHFYHKGSLTEQQIKDFERDIQFLLPIHYIFVPYDTPFGSH